MPSSAFSAVLVGVAGLAFTVVAAALLGRRMERRWRGREDPIGPGGMALPAGEATVVKTDDDAELAAMICEPATTPATSAAPGPTPATVVLVHCWAGSRQVWAPVARRLVDSGHRVVMYDQRGHGESTFGNGATPGAFTISRFGDDLATVLEQLDVRDAVVAGHSMGGFSLLAFACDHPEMLRERVRGLVLVATAAHGLGAGRLTPIVGRALSGNLPRWLFGPPRAGLVPLRRVVGREACYAHIATTRDLFLATPPDVRGACFECFAPMDLREGLADVEHPSVVMVGDRDRLTPAPLSRTMASALPNARLDVLDGAGHMLPFEAPDRVATAIADLAT